MGDERIMDQIKSHSLRTIREEFNDYDLEDGNIIRSKQVLISFGFTGERRMDETGKNIAKMKISMKHVAGVVSLIELDTSVLELYSGQPLDKSAYVKKIQFKPKQTFLNIYETDEFLITIENQVSEIWQTKYKDEGNTPLYHVVAEAKLDAKLKKDERETQKQLK